MTTVAILQARLGSTRLPGKMLLPVLGKPLVQQVLERVLRAQAIDRVVLAVPKETGCEQFDVIVQTVCKEQRLVYGDRLAYYRFDHIPAEDLVSRYLGAAKASGADLIVRIPGDNPCVDPVYVDEAVRHYQQGYHLFYTNTSRLCDGRVVDGVGAEVLSFSRLQWLDQATQGNARYREHPHQWFYDHLPTLQGWPSADLRLDVNTQTDYDFISRLYDHFGHNRFSSEDVLTYLTMKEVPHESVQSA